MPAILSQTSIAMFLTASLRVVVNLWLTKTSMITTTALRAVIVVLLNSKDKQNLSRTPFAKYAKEMPTKTKKIKPKNFSIALIVIIADIRLV
jgi:hypothetical protein